MLNRQDKPLIRDAFHKHAIDMLADPAREVKPVAMALHAYTTLDPHGGGHSQAALITTIEWVDPATALTCLVVLFLFRIIVNVHGIYRI